MLLLSLSLLTTLQSAPQETAPSQAVEVAAPVCARPLNLEEEAEAFLHCVIDSPLYVGAGALLSSAVLAARLSWAVCHCFPTTEATAKECLLASEILQLGAKHSLIQAFKRLPFLSWFFQEVPSSHSAWYDNEKQLAQIPAFAAEDRALLHFLKRRWLAKMTGSFPFLIDWLCPSFGISFQVHPESTNSYARDPSNKFSDTYRKRVDEWKRALPHPLEYPLILTRRCSLKDYLPLYLEVERGEGLLQVAEKLTHALPSAKFPVILDLTALAPSPSVGRRTWLQEWEAFQGEFSKHATLEMAHVICVQRVEQEEIGGMRLLPLSSLSPLEEQHQFLLEWVSRFGLAANRVELDRLFLSTASQGISFDIPVHLETRAEWASFLQESGKRWRSSHPQKTLMFRGTLQVLQDLYKVVNHERWEEVMRLPVRALAVQSALKKIKEQLTSLVEQEETISFHATVSRLEQVHADLSTLLEVFNPFGEDDFPEIFRRHLISIPKELHPFLGFGLHASGMTSLAGICRATEKMVGRRLRILYGENAYFECIHVAERIASASCFQTATEEEWREVDLLLAQFNPTVKRINFKVTEYQVAEYHAEDIAGALHRALKTRGGRPLSIAIDCTLDFSDSPRLGRLLAQFQNEIERGELNVLCYRSGLKFDLFGMDNYCGAPFFTLHNQDPQWAPFEALLKDPALQTDRLSVNWFCLVFQQAYPYLEAYRRQIFQNTRAVLDRVPKRLFSTQNTNYRLLPVAPDADPTFIDLKIFGPCHAFRGELLVGIFLTLKCMEAGYPLLFRPSIGFYHPNLGVLFGSDCTTVRLTLGLDPGQIDVIVHCLEKIDELNEV